MRAKYPGRCQECDEQTVVGEEIAWSREEGVRHPECVVWNGAGEVDADPTVPKSAFVMTREEQRELETSDRDGDEKRPVMVATNRPEDPDEAFLVEGSWWEGRYVVELHGDGDRYLCWSVTSQKDLAALVRSFEAGE